MNVISFQDELEKKTKKEIIAYADAQYHALQSSIEKIQKYEAEIKHLQELLNSNVQSVIKSPEQATVEDQINRLAIVGASRVLTAEEVKTLDILIKNKMLLNGQDSIIPAEAKKKRSYPEAVLISIAKKTSE